MLINLSNHPHQKWDEKQKQAAIEEYGWIEDIQFPAINPAATEEEVAEQLFSKITKKQILKSSCFLRNKSLFLYEKQEYI